MKYTLFTFAAFLAASVSASPLTNGKLSCYGPYGEMPCGSRDARNYTVVAGDTLTTIADKFKSGACDIAKYNNITDPDLIDVGDFLVVPANCAKTPDKTSCLKNLVQPTGTQNCTRGLSVDPPVYVVLPKDTFTLIANNFDLKLDVLKEANKNRFKSFDAIFAGNTTIIPICPGCSCTNDKHTIVSGDTFGALATKAGITVGQIEAANPGQIPTNLQIGQVINVPKCTCVA